MNENLTTQAFVPKYFKIESLTNILGNNPVVIIKLLEELIKGCEKNYNILNNNHIEKKWNLLKNNAHFLKSNFRYLGCQEVTTNLKEIELLAGNETSLIDENKISNLILNFNSNFPKILNEVKDYLQLLKKA